MKLRSCAALPFVLRNVCLILWVIIMTSQVAVSQQPVTAASLSGRVEDQKGAVISEASIRAINLATNEKHYATTDHHGYYRFPYLRVGNYRLEVNASGFSPLVTELQLTLGQAMDFACRLDPLDVTAQVNVVTADAPIVETVRTQVAET